MNTENTQTLLSNFKYQTLIAVFALKMTIGSTSFGYNFQPVLESTISRLNATVDLSQKKKKYNTSHEESESDDESNGDGIVVFLVDFMALL